MEEMKKLFGEQVITEIRDKKGRLVLKTTYSGGWYRTIAIGYSDYANRNYKPKLIR